MIKCKNCQYFRVNDISPELWGVCLKSFGAVPDDIEHECDRYVEVEGEK